MISLVCWLVLALVHMPPAAALFSPGLIRTLYGVEPGSETFLLLHHRAALFLSVSLVCGWAALRPEVRPLASVVVGVSTIVILRLSARYTPKLPGPLIALVLVFQRRIVQGLTAGAVKG